MRGQAAASLLVALMLAALHIGTAAANTGAATSSAAAAGRTPAPLYKELFFEQQRVDHYDYRRKTQVYPQRYLLNDTWWRRGSGPILFYAGNESPVEAYAENTGLMWENAEAFQALVVFAEHRYYGKSQPYGLDSVTTNPDVFSVQQAMADYVELAQHLRNTLDAQEAPIILFGGSYGGMLAGWLRLKFPHAFAGAIAASAPVGAFVSNLTGFHPSTFWAAVTRDATPEAGAAERCAPNTRRTFDLLFRLGASHKGRRQLADSFQLCKPLGSPDNVMALAYWIQGAFDSYSMGNYPYPSSYIAGTAEAPLPAWPMREACSHLAGKLKSDAKLLKGMKRAMDVLYNVSRDQDCYTLELTGAAGGPGVQTFLYQFCTDAVAQELPFFPANGETDMFWDQGPYNQTGIDEYCQREWGVTPRPDSLPLAMGGLDVGAGSNIVWSNGGYDPWHVAGVLESASETNVAVWIPEGAHHLDTMFSHPDDPPSVRQAREVEVAHMRRWVAEHRAPRSTVDRQRQQQQQQQQQQQLNGPGQLHAVA